MIQQIVTFLKQPFPKSNFRYTSFLMGLMVFLILALFQPFGLGKIATPKRYLIEFGYGLITFGALFINLRLLPALFPTFFSDDNWKVYKEVLFFLYNILIIATLNTAYSALLDFVSIDLVTFFIFLCYTLLVAIFPDIIIVLIEYNTILKRHLQDASAINSVISQREKQPDCEQILHFTGQTEGDNISIESRQILYIQSQRNYLEFFYIHNSEIKKKLIRATLKDLESSIASFNNLLRCHRSYIVNINRVKSIEGNSLGYKLHLEDTDCIIPVSRTYVKIFKNCFIKR